MKEFSEQGYIPLDTSKLDMTPLVRETLITLMMDISARLSYSPSRIWGSTDRNERPDYIGAWIAKAGYVGIENVRKIHGKTIIHLFNAGVVRLDGRRTSYKRAIFRLSDDALNNIRELRRAVMFPHTRTVRWEPLEELAALYGVKIHFQRARSLLKLTTLKDESFREDEYITENKSGEPVTKISDLTWEEWVEILAECADIIEGKGKPK